MASGEEELEFIDLTYMFGLRDRLISERGNKHITAVSTIATLRTLNGRCWFPDLTFLADVSGIAAQMADNTHATRMKKYSQIVAVLALEKEKYPELFATYKKILTEHQTRNDAIVKKRANTLTNKEAETWLTWDKAIDCQKRWADRAKIILRHTDLMPADFDDLQTWMLVSIFVLMPPRRAMDYHQMWFVNRKPGTDLTRNYYVRDEGKMYFNAYKTAKRYGQQVLDVPKELQSILNAYIKTTPDYKKSKGRKGLYPLIVDHAGEHIVYNNVVTRILNRAFNKKVSVNVLRHSYVTSLYTDSVVKAKDTAASMGHSVKQHLDYYRVGADSDSDSGSESSGEVGDVLVL